jgi:hypothetical protein
MVTYCCVFYLSHILKEKKYITHAKTIRHGKSQNFYVLDNGVFFVMESCAVSFNTWFIISCVEFRELFHLTCDLSQAEKKMNIVANEQVHKTTSISLKMVEVVILSENSCHFVSCSDCNNSYFLLNLR